MTNSTANKPENETPIPNKRSDIKQTDGKIKSGDLKFRNIKYYLAETFRNLVRNKIMTITSVITVAACLLIVVFSYAIASNVNFILAYLETSVPVMVVIEDELTVPEVDALFHEILQTENVTSATFITPEEALRNLAENLGITDGILAGLEEANPLGRSFNVELKDIRMQSQTVVAIGLLNGVARVNEASVVTDMLIAVNNFVGIFSFVVMMVLGILSVVIITNTIKLTVNNRRNEIIIMKYVGATDWFIKWPFVIEGIVIGIFGAIIPMGIMWASYDGLIDTIRYTDFQMLLQMPFRTATELFPIFAPVVMVLGVGIGILGSISAMRKYLSV
ncbi:MAG: permease-like cell division protein FtsX [Clostridiales bacterium]|nr:permease-like cell division protein FtsX [Clostridiales bacterium]